MNTKQENFNLFRDLFGMNQDDLLPGETEFDGMERKLRETKNLVREFSTVTRLTKRRIQAKR